MKLIEKKALPCPFQLELLAALERVLCFCHTGSTAVLATSLMDPLGLSKGATRDGFPMLHCSKSRNVFTQPTISSAMKHGFEVDTRYWPVKGGRPATASRRAQILTYSLGHYMVSLSVFRSAATFHPTISPHINRLSIPLFQTSFSSLTCFRRGIKLC